MTPLEATLVELVRSTVLEAVRDALAEREAAPVAPALLDRQQCAAALNIGTTSLDKLRREGMPEIAIGDSPRYELPAVLEWLRARPAHGQRSESSLSAEQSASPAPTSSTGFSARSRKPAKTHEAA